jgi:predicted HTH domain antitoxin
MAGPAEKLCFFIERIFSGVKVGDVCIKLKNTVLLKANQIHPQMVIIDDAILQAAKLTESEVKIELALALYQQRRLSFGQARKLADMEYFEFEKLLADRKIPSGYTVEDLHDDLATLQQVRTEHDSRQ